MTRSAPNRKANIWVARIIPVLLLGIIGYAAWVLTKLLCVDYLLNPPPFPSDRAQVASAIVILIIFYLLLFPLLITYARLLGTILTNPGYVPRSASWYQKQDDEKSNRCSKRRSRQRLQGSNHTVEEKEHSSTSSESSLASSRDACWPRVEDFWLKDVFICNYDGRPPFCSTCLNFKPDRAHHCSEVNRCVRKMDHFCPWVGGIVSETSFKFFIQFCFYAALFCIHTVVVVAYFFAQRSQREGGFLNAHWNIVLGFAGLFLFFSAGMFGSSVQLMMINSTTVENLSRKTRVWYLAVYLPRPEEVYQDIQARSGQPLRTITYPRPLEEQNMLLEQVGYRPSIPVRQEAAQPAMSPRTFAILETPRGFNPWDLGALGNLREVMGCHLIDWFLPTRHSPLAAHGDGKSMFRLGPQVERLKEDAGLIVGSTSEPSEKTKRRRRRSHRRRSREGSGSRRKGVYHSRRGSASEARH